MAARNAAESACVRSRIRQIPGYYGEPVVNPAISDVIEFAGEYGVFEPCSAPADMPSSMYMP